jgi:uncharacterized protein (TIGR02996 family)
MTHEDAFLQDILENREDDTPRRVFADWLLDHADPVQAARGELIHVQCDLARLPPGAPRPEHLLRRERQLLEAHGREWGTLFQRLGCYCWEYQRGFVEGVGMPASAFLAQAAALFRAAPVRELKLYGTAGLAGQLAGCPWLGRARTLDLEKNDLGDDDVEALAGSPHLGGLATLLLWCNQVGDAGAAALAAADLPRLARLDLSNNAVGDGGAAALAASPLLGRLALLDLTGNRVGDPGAQALAGSRHAGGLGWLDVSKNPVGLVGQNALRERFGGRVQVWG